MEISSDKLVRLHTKKTNWRLLRKGDPMRETESILIEAQKIAKRTNYIKAKIDNTQQSSKCRLYGEKDETNNYIISGCCKVAQKQYKCRHNWMGKVIP